MNYLRKLKLFSGTELIYVFLTSIGKKFSLDKLIKFIPHELVNFMGLLVALDRQKIIVKKYRDLAFFNYTINNQVFKIFLKRNSSDAHVFKGVIVNQDYREVVSLLKKYSIPCNVIIDAGANIGLTSIYFKAYFPDAKTISLEPASGTFRRLRKNIEDNNLANVHLLEKGLWSHKTTLSADRSFRDGEDWSFRLSTSKLESENKIETVSVADLIKDFSIPVIDILKIDIEGAEAEVFNAKSKVEWLSQVRVICMEIHDEFDCRNDIEALLVNYGFDLMHSGELTIGINKSFVK